MSDNLTFGINITANSAQLVGAVKESSAAFDGLKLSTNEVNAAIQRQNALHEAQQAYFDAQRDKAWALANGYKEVNGQLINMKAAALESAAGLEVQAVAMEKSAFATVGARRELMVLGHEAMSGNFSKIPGSMMVLAERVNISGKAMMGLAAAAGAVYLAWEAWGTVALQAYEDHKKSETAFADETAEILANLDKQITSLKERNKLWQLGGVSGQSDQENDKLSSAYNTIQKEAASVANLIPGTMQYATAMGILTKATQEYNDIANRVADRNAAEDQVRANEKGPAKVKKSHKDPEVTWEASTLKQMTDLQDQATGKTDGLTRAQIDLLKTMDDPRWAKASDQWKIDYVQRTAAASDAENQRADQAAADKADAAATNASIAAREEYEKIVSRAQATAGAQIEQLQFQNSLLGKNTLEVLQLTEAHKIELDLKQKLQALSTDLKFATRNKGDGPFNPGVELEYQQSVQAEKDAAKGSTDAAKIRIENNYDEARSWDHGLTDAINTYMNAVTNSAAQSNKLYTDFFKGTEDAMVNFVKTGKLNFTSLADSIVTDLLRIQVQESIMAPLSNAIQSSGGFSGLFKGLFNADGNAFDSGGVHAFADGGTFTNGIFDSPTAFKFADGGGFSLGVMGEAGSEAVMPLTRGPDGKLGVSAQSSGNSSSVIVNQPLTINAQNASAETVARIRALMPMFIAENSRTVVGAVNQALMSRGQMPIRS